MKWKQILRERAESLDPNSEETIKMQKQVSGEIPVDDCEIQAKGFDYLDGIICPVCKKEQITPRDSKEFACEECGLIFRPTPDDIFVEWWVKHTQDEKPTPDNQMKLF